MLFINYPQTHMAHHRLQAIEVIVQSRVLIIERR